MASNFWAGEFYFNGESSSSYNICIIDFNENNILKQIGNTFNISMEKEIAYRGNPLHREVERTSDNITLQLGRTDGKAWREGDITDVTGWLFQEGFKMFQPTDFTSLKLDTYYNLVYYLKAIEMRKFLNPNLEGYLEIVFQPYDSYVYMIPNAPITISGGQDMISVTNPSNVNNIYYPKMRIRNTETSVNTTMTIRNLTNGKSLSINGVNRNEIITIDCAIGSVIDGDGKNRFDILQNYDFIGLNKGNNNISLTPGFVVEFVCEFPMII